MARDRSPQPSAPGRALLDNATPADLEAIRLLLQGASAIDWHRLAFSSYLEIDRFLRVNEFDPDSDEDLNRLEELRDEAVEYLARNFDYQLPTEVREGIPVRELFMLASQRGRRHTYACVVLKVMHVIHHLAGRELAFKLPISNDEVFGYVEKKVVRVVDEIRGAGYPVVEFAWSRKERDSLITKLLAKKDSIAASVYDRLRFRLITRSREDLAPVLVELTHRLVPFNYVIPEQSVNGIVPFRRLLEGEAALGRFADQLQADLDGNEVHDARNEFSGPSYRVINFVADLPIRIDDYLVKIEGDPEFSRGDGLGNTIFVLTEFQVMDAETARNNEVGDSSHAAYKERQKARVKARLTGGSRALRERAASPPDEEG
jgi:uncharacterized protein (TIGR04552 family)